MACEGTAGSLHGLCAAMRSDDLGFRLVGHFWTQTKYFEPLYQEFVRAVADETSGANV